MKKYYPENYLITTEENKNALSSKAALKEACYNGRVLEARAIICDKEHNLHVDLGIMKGIIPRTEGAIGIDDGTVRDIAIISRVNKPVMFKITDFQTDDFGETYAVLSRKAVQTDCMNEYISALTPGCVIDAVVTHMENFGIFVDIGAGISALMPIDSISVSRIPHPSARFTTGQKIKAVVKSIDENGRITLSYKELLGTWEQNASLFKAGETVPGIVRSVERYGIFVELKPNLAGLAEYVPGVVPGQHASVYIKNLIPERMKIKLIIVDSFDAEYPNEQVTYYNETDFIDRWVYSPENCAKTIETVFSPYDVAETAI
ncbi:MAG: S1 RNA-binding domain-containing protein [Faecalibacterium sp.]|nr:S1 RNA-binding domain-containing protein [Ruminococcus sp.]MCM1391212.1 S1 RNA-binding domain-containing protein [Ruminococcus sp.]MCM1485660.1 S1 RNA-binding domain-containing protein [Faecalibacterium sp.]